MTYPQPFDAPTRQAFDKIEVVRDGDAVGLAFMWQGRTVFSIAAPIAFRIECLGTLPITTRQA